MEKRWISPKECAIYLSLHVKSVYRLIDKGVILASRIGGSVRVDKKRLDEMMEAQEQSIDNWSEKLRLK